MPLERRKMVDHSQLDIPFPQTIYFNHTPETVNRHRYLVSSDLRAFTSSVSLANSSSSGVSNTARKALSCRHVSPAADQLKVASLTA